MVIIMLVIAVELFVLCLFSAMIGVELTEIKNKL